MINRGLLLIYCQKGDHSNPHATTVLRMESNIQAAVKIFFVAFWVPFFTLAENQECLKKDINFENTLKSDLLEKYKTGQSVKLSCATGYVGVLRLECENGIWKKVGGRECKKRPCGHPGDTPNGDFKLVRESEFVFGATVEYTCRTGYIMASRVNYRNCRSQGWDNAVPVCEVVKCPIISNLGDVIATGNTEEASYSDVIHFECASPNKMLSGPQDIHCKDDGRWSGDIPKCIEIKCLPPEIPHGFTNPDQEYKENNILQYRCERGYNPRSGTPRCTKYGWSIKPECEEIICLLGSPTNSVVSTNPRGKNIFKAGEHVEIICSRDHWVFGTKQESRTIECQENGKWEFRPVCEEITCEYPHGQHLSYPQPYYRPVYKLRERMWYKCEHGYQSKATTATCTENGWEPKPLCTESTCQKPEIAHGEVVGMLKDTYKLNEQIEIQCDRGYKPEKFAATCTQNGEWDKMQNCKQKPCGETSLQNGFIHELDKGFSYSCGSEYKAFDEKWWGVVICTAGQQSYAPLCIPEDRCGQVPNVHAKHNQAEKAYENEATVELECESKPCCFKCIRGQWAKQDCESKRCGIPPRVENAVITSHNQQQVEYKCRENYKINREQLIFCINSQWEDPPTCESGEEPKCPDPEREINNATLIRANLKAYYQEGGTVEYKCKKGFQFQDGTQATCSEGQWNYPQCVQLGEELKCPDPEREINNATLIRANLKAYYQEGGTVEYKCKKGFQFQDGTQATCSEGQWNYPQCIQSLAPLNTHQEERNETVLTEESSLHEDATAEQNRPLSTALAPLNTHQEERNETVLTEESSLHEDATAEQNRPLSTAGEELKCPAPAREINNATLIRPNLKASYQEGGTVEYKCKKGFQFQDGTQATCSEGQWNYPQCVKQPKPPRKKTATTA
ncbi:hypothetical protein PHYPO_G00029110 [Pangasianodon hypophthalmus]|uniref:Sushi domain-containing protein n=2 Tax=Pangasianodon hypophthalmus TaxID=310915 RepID=A0A5N5MYD1_PANHP|nr:hypothetical protein PHYPO_G00029110 [Pangasianodon hypophthalmus]